MSQSDPFPVSVVAASTQLRADEADEAMNTPSPLDVVVDYLQDDKELFIRYEVELELVCNTWFDQRAKQLLCGVMRARIQATEHKNAKNMAQFEFDVPLEQDPDVVIQFFVYEAGPKYRVYIDYKREPALKGKYGVFTWRWVVSVFWGIMTPFEDSFLLSSPKLKPFA